MYRIGNIPAVSRFINDWTGNCINLFGWHCNVNLRLLQCHAVSIRGGLITQSSITWWFQLNSITEGTIANLWMFGYDLIRSTLYFVWKVPRRNPGRYTELIPNAVDWFGGVVADALVTNGQQAIINLSTVLTLLPRIHWKKTTVVMTPNLSSPVVTQVVNMTTAGITNQVTTKLVS